MPRRFEVRVAALSFLLMGIAGSTLAAEGDPGPKFDGNSALELADKPVPFTIKNDTQKNWHVIVSGSVLHPDGKSMPLSVGLSGAQVVTERMEFDLGHVDKRELFVSFVGSPPKAARGWLRLIATSSGATVERQRPVVRASSTVSPAVASWNLTRIGHLIGGVDVSGTEVPIKGAGACPSDLEPVEVVVGTGTHSATLAGTCKSGDNGTRVLSLTMPDLKYGNYTGTWTVGDDKLAFTIRSTRAAGLAVVLLLAGILLAVVLRGSNSNAIRRQLHSSLRSLQGDAKTTEDRPNRDPKFVEANPLVSVVEAERDRLRAELRNVVPAGRAEKRLRWVSWVIPFPEARATPVYDAVKARVNRLEMLVEGWDEYAKAWLELRAIGPGVSASFELARALGEKLQGIIDSKAPGKIDLHFIDEMLERVAEVRGAGTAQEFLARIKALADARERHEAVFEREPAKYGPLERQFLAEAHVGYRRVRARLLRVDSCADLADAELIQLIDEWQNALDALPRLPVVTAMHVEMEGELAQAQSFLTLPSVEPLLKVLLSVRAWAREKAEPFGTAASVGVPIVAAVIVAIITGLQALYFDKIWATPLDMSLAVIWGFTTAAVLSPLFQAIEAATVGRLVTSSDAASKGAKPAAD